jgi:branched-chain amino acid transport system substrate-binding protein
MERTQRMPNMIQVGTYSAVTQYLKAVEAAGTDATDAVAEKMHELPVEDVFAKKGTVQENGRMVYDMYLFQVKAPDDSTQPWDYYNEISTVPGNEAFLSVEDSGCDVASFAK